MFKKQLIVVAIFGLLCTLLIGVSAFNVSNNANSFAGSGYVHCSSSQSEDKRVFFNSGTTYKKKVDGIISFNDVVGKKSSVDAAEFIHYDNSSLASFTDGVLVDLQDISDSSAMNHYAISAGTVLEYSGSSYSVTNSKSNDYAFKDFIWKVDENKYMMVSPSLKFRDGDKDEKNINGYAEITYIGDKLIQVQTEDNVWTTISDDAHLITSNGIDLQLAAKTVSDSEGKVLLDFSRIVTDSKGNIELSPLETKETVIPHFSITAENGADGLSGMSGESGESGTSGKPGTPGTDGRDAEPGHDGEEAELGHVINFPVFTITDWVITENGCRGTINVTDDDIMLQPNDGSDPSLQSQVYILDLDTGEQITSADLSGIDFSTTHTQAFSFEGKLKADHNYMLQIVAPTLLDDVTYGRQYISKTFWTDSTGIYMEPAGATINSVTFNAINRNYNASTSLRVFYKAFKTYQEAVNASTAFSADWVEIPNTAWSMSAETNVYKVSRTIPDSTTPADIKTHLEPAPGDRNKVYVRLAYAFSGGTISDFTQLSSQIQELTPLKQQPTIAAPILTQNRTTWGFDVKLSAINDPNNGIVSYTYEFYSASQFETDSGTITDKLKPSQTPVKTITKFDQNAITTALDGVNLKAGVTYRVRVVAQFNDGEKTYSIPSGFSNTSELTGSVRPNVYFEALLNNATTSDMGSYVELPFYDSAWGYLWVNPGNNGSRLLVGKVVNSEGAEVEHRPIITIKLDGYYTVKYPVYVDDEVVPATVEKYILISRNDDIYTDGRVKITFNDIMETNPSGQKVLKGTAQGLQPNKTYEIYVNGDLSDNGQDATEVGVDIGRCMVKTKPTTPLTAVWTHVRTDESDALKSAKIKMTSSFPDDEQDKADYAREVNNMSELSIGLFYQDFNTEEELNNKTPNKVVTIKPGDVDGDGNNIYDQIFCRPKTPGSSEKWDGFSVNSGFFGLTSDQIKEYSQDTGKITLDIRNAYDYTNLATNRFAQEQWKSTNINNDKSSVSGGYYYINKFDLLEHSMVISNTAGINSITTVNDFGSGITVAESADHNEYVMKANYSNSMNAAGGGFITYYVFDAVDFFADSSIKGKDWSDNLTGTNNIGGFAKYTYTALDGTVTEYPQNHIFVDWVKQADYNVDGTLLDKSFALQTETPVNCYGLALATITIPVNNKADMPSVVFIPMNKNDYEPGDLQPKNTNGQFYMFFGETETNKGSAWSSTYYTPKAENIPAKGHQYVFAWTVCCHTEEAQVKYVFPFDAKVSDTSNTPFKTFAGEVNPDTHIRTTPNAKIKDSTVFGNSTSKKSDYLADNGEATYGYSAYMLIPHSTFTKTPKADVPFNAPQSYAIQWSSDADHVVMRASLYQTNDVVAKNDDGTTNVYNLTNPTTGQFTQLSGVKIPVVNTSIDIDESYAANFLLDNTYNTSMVGEISISSSNVSSYFDDNKEVHLYVPIQRYINKYTVKNTPLHSNSNSYISGRSNWTFRSYNESPIQSKFSKAAYHELLGTVFTASPYTERTEELIAGGGVDSTFEWRMTGGKIQNALITVTGSQELLSNAVGVRVYFISKESSAAAGTVQTFFVDKFLVDNRPQYGDMFKPEGLDIPFVSVEGNKLKLQFKVNVADELSKNNDGTNQHFNFSDTSGVEIKMKLLYETDDAGYKGIKGDTLYPTYKTNGGLANPTTNAGYAIRKIKANTYSYSEGNNILIYNKKYEGLYQFKDNTPNKFSLASDIQPNAPRFGSFFRVSASGNILKIYSTRQWQFKSVDYHTDVFINPLVDQNQVMTLPVKLRETDNGIPIGNISGSTDVTIDETVTPNKYYINTPPTPPSIEYDEIDRTKVHTNDAQVKYGISGGTTGEVVYFTVSVQEPDKTDLLPDGAPDGRPDTSKADYYKFNYNEATDKASGRAKGADGLVNFKVVGAPNTTEKKPTETKSSSVKFENSEYYDNLKEFMMPTSSSNVNLKFEGLVAATKYYVTCYRWTQISDEGGGKYGFVRIPFKNTIDTSSENNEVPNYCQFTTDGWPEVSFDHSSDNAEANSYIALQDDMKYIFVKVKYDTFDSDQMYYTIELLDSGKQFLSYFLLSSQLSPNYFDVDNIDLGADKESKPSNGKNIYTYIGDSSIGENAIKNKFFNKLDPSSSLAPTLANMASDPTHFKKIELEYGKKYYLKIHAYKKGEGPAYNPGTEYGFGDDLDSLFVDRNHTDLSPDPETDLKVRSMESFTIENHIDTSKVTVESNIFADQESYVTFTPTKFNVKSGSIKGNRIIPVVVWAHVVNDDDVDRDPTLVKGTFLYYDVSNGLYMNNTEKTRVADIVNNHFDMPIEGQMGMNINISKANTDPATSASLPYVNVFDVDDRLYFYSFAYQGGEYTEVTGRNTDTISGKIVGTNIITAADFFDKLFPAGRRAYKPKYDAQDGTYPKQHPMTQEEFNSLSIIMDNQTDDPGHSRVLASNVVNVESVGISAGRASITFNEDDNKIYIALDSATTPSGIKAMAYCVWAKKVTNTEYGQETSWMPAANSETGTPAGAPSAKIKKVSLLKSDNATPKLVDKGNNIIIEDLQYYNDIDKTITEDGKPKEQIYEYNITIYFTSTPVALIDSVDEVRVKFSSNIGDGQDLSDDNEVLHYRFRKSLVVDESGLNPPDSGEPPIQPRVPLTTSLGGFGTNLLNKLFGGNAKDGAK